jgi:outer membrane receptor protein involved in Fe transport
MLSAEAGSFGVRRLMGSASAPVTERGAFRVDVNVTHNDGWRDQTAYDRQSFNFRWDHKVGEFTTIKTILGFSRIDQETGANSALPFSDYVNNPTRNNLSIAYRKVDALRLSVEFERQFGTGMVSIIPYYRDNRMELNPSFGLSSDPRIENGKNVSYGALLKWRKNFPAFMRMRLIGGTDLDYSPGSRREDNLLVTRSGTGANTFYSAYTRGTHIYDYDVTFKSVSPYLHTEISPIQKLRITAGLRYDMLGFDMSNNLKSEVVQASVLGANRFYGQIPEDATSYKRFSPKFGATFRLAKNVHLYASHNHGFRGPSESQLYRAGNDTSFANAIARAQLAVKLRPIRADQNEVGVRGEAGLFTFNVVGYHLVKKDDLVSQRDLATNVTTSVNAGETEHQGVEIGLGARLPGKLRLDTAFSYARHTYMDWVTATAAFSGKEIESAPSVITSTRMAWTPTRRVATQLEWVHLGSYWLEASNSPLFGKYPGHDLYNVRASYMLTKSFSLTFRVINALDKRFADSSSVSSNTPVFTPGLPRAFYGGVEARW